MRRRGALRLGLGSLGLGMAGLLAGCASPRTHYFRIAPLPGAPLPGGPRTLGVRSVSIPGYLDRNGIAEASGAYELDLSENDVWADGLAPMLQAAMAADLARRLPGSTVIATGGAIGATPDLLVEIDVQRFDPDASGRITLTAQVAIEAGATLAVRRRAGFTKSAAPASAGTAGTVAAMSALWAALADDIARMAAAAA